ncbi:MAG: riboflavin synthase, partial [Candidatus Zixiibacteriota bacterium]
MFTGIIESVGTVKNLKTRGDYRILTIAPAVPFEQVVMGESIACDGACLTVVAFDKDQFTVEASQ